jgi:hypothetical protein
MVPASTNGGSSTEAAVCTTLTSPGSKCTVAVTDPPGSTLLGPPTNTPAASAFTSVAAAGDECGRSPAQNARVKQRSEIAPNA